VSKHGAPSVWLNHAPKQAKGAQKACSAPWGLSSLNAHLKNKERTGWAVPGSSIG